MTSAYSEASGGLPGVRSALTEHANIEWLQTLRGNEKLLATQLEPWTPFDAMLKKYGPLARERS